MSGTQTNNIQLLDSGLLRSVEASDTLQVSAQLELIGGANLVVGGNLTVLGTTVSTSSEQVQISDNFLNLNAGYTTPAAQSGGLVVNYLPTATSTAVAATGFTAGVASVSNPTVHTVGASTFSVGQLVQVSGANNPSNNGVFEVLSHAANLLTVRGVGITAATEVFTSTQFVTDTTVAGTITRVNVSILRAGTDGIWETGQGSSTPITFVDLAAGGADTLQSSYEAGNSIVTSAAEGNLTVAGTEQLLVTTTGGINLDTVFDFDGTSFDVQMAGGSGFSIDGDAASNVSVANGNLTLSTITSGTLIVNAVAALDMDAASMTLDTTGAFSIDGAAASNVSVTSNNLTLSTITSGSLIATSAGLWDLNAGANLDIDVTGTFDMLSTSSFSIDGTGNSNVSATSGSLTLSTITLGTLFVTSAGILDMDGTSATLDTTADFSIDGAAASNVSVTGANLTLSTITSGSLIATSAGLWDLNAGANLDIDVTGTFDMLSTGVFSIDGTGNSNVSATSGDLTISTITSGQLFLTSAGSARITVPTAGTSTFQLRDGTNTYLNVDGTNSSLDLSAPFTNIPSSTSAIGWERTTDSGLVEGDLVCLVSTTGNVKLADADTGTLKDGWVVGVSRGTFSASGTARIMGVHGQIVPVRFSAAPAAASNGAPVYLSTSAGLATLTAPSGGNNKVVFVVGTLIGADGSDTTPDVVFAPQYISKGAGVS